MTYRNGDVSKQISEQHDLHATLEGKRVKHTSNLLLEFGLSSCEAGVAIGVQKIRLSGWKRGNRYDTDGSTRDRRGCSERGVPRDEVCMVEPSKEGWS